MKIYYRYEIEPPASILDPNYKSAHHITAAGGLHQGLEMHSLFRAGTLPEGTQICKGCGGYRIKTADLKRIAIPPYNLPDDFDSGFFCFEYEGVCCLESLDEIRHHTYRATLLDVDVMVVAFEGKEIERIYDAVIVRPTRIVEAKPLSEWE